MFDIALIKCTQNALVEKAINAIKNGDGEEHSDLDSFLAKMEYFSKLIHSNQNIEEVTVIQTLFNCLQPLKVKTI